jgi:hypothetical protein
MSLSVWHHETQREVRLLYGSQDYDATGQIYKGGPAITFGTEVKPGHAVAQFDEALRYKPEKSRVRFSNFSCTSAAVRPWGLLSL